MFVDLNSHSYDAPSELESCKSCLRILEVYDSLIIKPGPGLDLLFRLLLYNGSPLLSEYPWSAGLWLSNAVSATLSIPADDVCSRFTLGHLAESITSG